MPSDCRPSSQRWRLILVVATLTIAVLLLSVPASLQHTRDHGGCYLFSREFIDDIPKRLTGPGGFRLILQPVLATLLGIRSGRADARAGRPPYLSGVLFHGELRRELLRDALATVSILLLMGILLDSLFQWLILGNSYLGAALVVGPVLIGTPYVIARGLTNRLSR
jgi:hypothetical protein